MSQSHAAKRNRATWALAAVFVGLVVSIGFIQWHSSTERTFPIRSADTVSTITITRSGNDPIVLQREENWRITSPVNLTANEQRILPLLTVYTNPDPGYAIASVDLDATGLNTPEVTVSFDDYEVKIGDLAINGGRRHALHGDRVRFVPEWVLPFLKGGISALADLTVWGNGLNTLEFEPSLALNDASFTQAKQLTAQQLVKWPRSDNPVVLTTFAAKATTNQVESDWTVFVTDSYVAIQAIDSNFAYIVGLDEVPWLLK